MNKYFLLLITSFASLSLNAAEGQSGKKDEWTFTEKGTTRAGEIYYMLDNSNGDHVFVQLRANKEVVLKVNSQGEAGAVVDRYDAGLILTLCEENKTKFQKIINK